MTGSLRRLRVLFVLDSPTDQGGAERFALGLATHLPRDRFEPWVCSTRFATPEASELLAEAGVTHISLRRTGKLDVYRLGGLAMLLRSGRFDIVHAHMFGSNVWGTVMGKLCGVPVVLAHEHNWSYSGEFLRRMIDRNLIARYATRFVAVSESNRTRMIELEGIPAGKVLVLPTAYIPHRVTTPTDIRAELGLAPDARIIGVAATLRVEKALEVMVSAVAEVVARFPETHLVIAGDGPCREALENQVSRLGLTGHVHLLGERRDVTSILHNVEVGAMSSDWEGMPLFVLECMATGTPVVATNVGGLPEMIEDDRTGLLVPPRDPGALAAAIIALLADPARGRRLAAAATARAHAFTIETVTMRFADLYEQLVNERRPELDSPGRGADVNPALVLCYHAVSPTWESELSVAPDALERQVDHLVRRGWRPTTFSDAVLGPRDRSAFAVTFDDAFATVRMYAAPVLRQFGVRGTLFVPTSFMEGDGILSWPGIKGWHDTADAAELRAMTWEQVGELAEYGWEIGSHTHSHPHLTKLDDAGIREELAVSRDELTGRLGRRCDSIAYPYGDVNDRVEDLARQTGYRTAAALPGSFSHLNAHRYARLGVYHNDGPFRFWLKVVRGTRWLGLTHSPIP